MAASFTRTNSALLLLRRLLFHSSHPSKIVYATSSVSLALKLTSAIRDLDSYNLFMQVCSLHSHCISPLPGANAPSEAFTEFASALGTTGAYKEPSTLRSAADS